jgi:GTP cyclohydrolase I
MSAVAHPLPEAPAPLGSRRKLEVVGRSPAVDLVRAERAMSELLAALGQGVGVVLEAEHLCMSLRGVQATGARTVTSTLHGLLRSDPRSRQEFLALARTAT